jgi:hypothetical protein
MQKPRYGGRKNLIEILLRKWVAEQRTGGETGAL